MLLPRTRAGVSLILTCCLAAGLVPLLESPSAAVAACVEPPIGAPLSTTADATGFVAVAPQRLVDTRLGLGAVQGPLGAKCVLRVPLDGATTPVGATAAVLTVTAAGASEPTFLTVFACDSPRPYVSHLNPRPDDPVPGLAIVPLDSSRAACVYADAETQVIVDVTGWYAPGGTPLHEITPVRVLDTRTAPRPAGLAPGRPGAGTTVRIPLAGTVLPDAARAVTAVVTVTNAALPTYATAAPCGATPGTSTVNTLPGVDRGAPAMVGLDSGGALCVFTEQSADLLVDITGWFGADEPSTTLPLVVPGSPLRELTALRLADSRDGTGGWTAPFSSGEVRRLRLLDAVAVGATAVQLEVIATDSTSAGYLTAYPCGALQPTTSIVNFRPGGSPESSLLSIGLGAGGEVCLSAFGSADVVIDLIAVHGTTSVLRALAASPGLDRAPLPGQPDHTVHCPVGGGPVRIVALAAPGGTVSVGGGPAAASVDVTRSMLVDELVSIYSNGPGTAEQTWLRCLPNDFPALTASGVSPTTGWYRAAAWSPSWYAFVLDEFGVPVWYKRTPYPVIGLYADGPGGLAWRKYSGGGFPTEGPGPGVGVERRALDGSLVGMVSLPDDTVGWHEYLVLPNGNRLVIVYSESALQPGTDDACVNAFTGMPVVATRAVNGHVVELDPAGNVVWRWNSEDHVADAENTFPLCFDIDPSDGVTTWGLDLLHINALDVFPDGDVLVTARHLDAAMRIDRATGAVEWKLGGTPPQEGTALGIVDDPRNGPVAPHDARVLPNGNVTMHDNRTGAAQPASRAVEYSVQATTATLVWSRAAACQCGTLGSVRRLVDGSTVIGWGTGTSPWFEQVLADGSPALTIDVPFGVYMYRAEPSPAADFDRSTLRAAAGGPTVASA